MHWLDVTILVALGIGAAFGFWSGLLWQIARVVGLLISLYLAIASNTPFADWIGEHWKDTSSALCRVIAFVVVFLIVYLFLYWITHLAHKAIKASKLEMVDRILGSLLGMVKMAAMISGICAGLAALGIPLTRDWLEQSTLAPHFARSADLMVALVPAEFRERVDDNLHQARDQIQKKVTDAALDAAKK